MYACQSVTLDFFEQAPFRFEASVEVPATPDAIFDSFEDAHAWTVWVPPIRHVEWTSPKPFGVGTTRTVTMSGGMIGREEFIAWERGSRMAFRFVESSQKNLRAFAEDYQVVELGPGASQLTWKVAMEVTGINRTLMPLFAPLMRPGLAWMLRRFARHMQGA